ncbi:hypothetical protein Spb1_02690 [Planctopirus ephydatiae]|uniref:DUF1573 domain-containing protein n=2 Tax=Planctopirus ephydatiae TaxID=2528019 RepID=A0A518GIJ4_9PLAN|nr:hypothetical protein Spb1_02690 [Planctopirus ephydatiae]
MIANMFRQVSRLFHATCLLAIGLLTVGSTHLMAQELNWANKMLERQNIDFGTVARGADTVYRLKIRNIYKEDVQLLGTRTSCGCSKAKLSTNLLKSGEEGYVEIAMDTYKFMREKTSNVFVTFSIANIGTVEVQIPLRVYIRTDVVLTPGAINFGGFDVGAGKESTVNVAYAGRPDWTITGINSSNPLVTATFVETSRSGGAVNYQLIAKVSPDAPVGDFGGIISLTTNDVGTPAVPVPFNGRVEAEFVITPSLLTLGNLVPGTTKALQVVIRSKKPFAIEKIECETVDGAFQVKLPTTTAPVHVLPMTLKVPDLAGPLNETFTISLPGRPNVIQFKATGTIISAPAAPATNPAASIPAPAGVPATTSGL